MELPVSGAPRPRVAKALCAALLLAAAGCNTRGDTSAPREPPAVPIAMGVASQKSVPVQVRAIGNVEAYSTVSVKTMVGGQIVKVGFVEGQEVRRGDLLFVIDPRPYQEALRSAEAALAKDVAVKENADKDVARYAMLIKRDLVPRQQYDQLVSNAAALGATIDADRAAVENARVQLGYCTVRSPIDGRTGSVLVNAGNVVKANDVPLVTINQVAPIRVSFSVPEQRLADIRKYRDAGTLKIDAFPRDGNASAAVGALSFIGNAVDQATGTIQLKGTFPNGDRRLWPGEFVNVVLTLATRPDAVVVPSQAIQTGQQGQYVFVVKPGGTAEMRPVEAGESLDGETVVEKGVRAGETVVTDGQLRLVPGSRVTAKQ